MSTMDDRLIRLGGLCALLAGCAVAGQGQDRALAGPASAPTAVLRGELPGDSASLSRSAREHWLKRATRAELESAIASWEQVALRSPGDAETRLSLARAIHLLADGHVRDESSDRAVALAERGAAYALEALLASSPELKARLAERAALEDSLQLVDVRAVPALYWHALNLRTSSDVQGPGAVVRSAARIKRMMERCLELDERYYYAGPHRYLAVFYARAPFVGGGSLEKSEQHFRRVLDLAPGFLGTRVYWAEFYAVKVNDQAGFQRELDLVLSQRDDVEPELVPENLIAKRRARDLLGRKAELF